MKWNKPNKPYKIVTVDDELNVDILPEQYQSEAREVLKKAREDTKQKRRRTMKRTRKIDNALYNISQGKDID